MFPGYIFVDTDDAGELEQKIGILAGSAKLPLDEKAVPLEKAEEDFPETSASRGSAAYGKTIFVQVNEAGEIVSAEGILGESLGQIVRKRIRETGCDAGDADAGSSTAGRTGDPCKRR